MRAYNEAGLPVKNMLIGERKRRGAAAYISVDSDWSDPDPLGTAFFLDVPWGAGRRLTYAVTARHCVDGVDETIYIEGTDAAGQYRKVPTTPNSWLRSAKTDLACRLLEPEQSKFFAVDIQHNLATGTIPCGLDVFMIGLFSISPRRHNDDGSSTIEPIVRFGKISLPLTKAQVYFNLKDEGNPDKATTVAAMLVECTSFEGESGSPVFMYQEHTQDPSPVEMEGLLGGIYASPVRPRPRPMHISDEDVYTPLLGILSAHWKVPSTVRGARKKKVGEVGLNSGIGIVIPASDIRDFIMSDDAVKREREKIPQGRPGKPSSPLSNRHEKPEGDFTKEDFEAALKKASRKLEPTKT
jgi:hypothetical protein